MLQRFINLSINGDIRLLLLIGSIFAIAISLIVTEQQLPTQSSELADWAWEQLQIIASAPRPYNSLQNDIVRTHILDTVGKIASEHDDIVVDDDTRSTVFLTSSSLVNTKEALHYFEGSNVIVRLPGTCNLQGAVLVSAHFDSVSTAYGATDDGCGTASAMAIVKHFAENRPCRDILVNINNAEEDFLWGAEAFKVHPWASDVVAFVNLEGAGAGGPSMMFRSSDEVVSRHYSAAPWPRATILGNDFFSMGLIRSETDYVVYETLRGDNGTLVPGIDIAFFYPRALYHTLHDSMANFPKGSLIHMLENALAVVASMADSGKDDDYELQGKPVYFDFFGIVFADARLSRVLLTDLLILLIGPWVLGAALMWRIKTAGIVSVRGTGLLLGSVFSSLLFTVLAVSLIALLKPLIIYSHPQIVLMIALLSNFTSLYLCMRLPFYSPSFRLFKSPYGVGEVERVITWELAVFWWIVLFVSTIFSKVKEVGFTYFVSINFVCIALACLLTLMEPSSLIGRDAVDDYEAVASEEDDEEDEAPLLTRRDVDNEDDLVPDPYAPLSGYKGASQWLWILRFLISVPLPLMLALETITWTLLPALNQIVLDGVNPLASYIPIAIFCSVGLVNITPFLTRIPLSRVYIVLIVLFTSSICAIVFLSPFNSSNPAKVYFYQDIDLDNGNNTVHLIGLEETIIPVLESLPSIPNSSFYTCSPFWRAKSALDCTYTGIPPLIDAFTTRLQTQGEITNLTITSESSRVCEVSSIDSHHPLEIIQVGSSEPSTTTVANTLRVFKRDKSLPMHITFQQEQEDGEGALRISCSWDEWLDGSVPSLDELIANAPSWVTFTKYTTGLVHGYKTIKQ